MTKPRPSRDGAKSPNDEGGPKHKYIVLKAAAQITAYLVSRMLWEWLSPWFG